MPLASGKSKSSFVHNIKAELAAGKPMAQSLAIAYSQKRKAKKMAEGGPVDSYEPSMKKMEEEDTETTHDMEEGHSVMADGGEVEQSEKLLHDHIHAHGDVVERAMAKRYSEGGKVSNEGEDELSHLADSDPNNFDDLALDDSLESHNTGTNSGDFLGDAQEDEDRSDIVARAMKQRNMSKNRNPRPA